MAKRGWVRFKVPISTDPGQIQAAVDTYNACVPETPTATVGAARAVLRAVVLSAQQVRRLGEVLRQAFARHIIHDVENTETPAKGELIVDKV